MIKVGDLSRLSKTQCSQGCPHQCLSVQLFKPRILVFQLLNSETRGAWIMDMDTTPSIHMIIWQIIRYLIPFFWVRTCLSVVHTVLKSKVVISCDSLMEFPSSYRVHESVQCSNLCSCVLDLRFWYGDNVLFLELKNWKLKC